MTESAIVEWSPRNHHRFWKSQRQTVVLLLLMHRRTKFLPRDLLLNVLLPIVIERVEIPVLYVSNLPFETEESDLQLFLDRTLSESGLSGKTEHVRIARRQNGRSKGFGFLRMWNVESSDRLLHFHFHFQGRAVDFRTSVGN